MTEPDSTTTQRRWVVGIVVALIGALAPVVVSMLDHDSPSPPYTPPTTTAPTSVGPTISPPTAQTLPAGSPPVTQSPYRPSPVPEPPKPQEAPANPLVGEWVGSGNQYPNDGYRMQLDVVFAPDGGYATVRGGATRETGIYAVNGTAIIFQTDLGQQYAWAWTFSSFGARRVLRIQNESGGLFVLQQV